MGTRAYAEKVCAAIDPDGKIFGNRILSRDESGSKYDNSCLLGTLLTRLFSRFDTEESAPPFPLRHVDGRYHR